MKLYSRTSLILGMLCGLIVIREVTHYDGTRSLLWIGFALYLMGRSFYTAFSKDGYDDQQRQAAYSRQVKERIFGKYWPIGEWGHLLLIGVGLLITWLTDGSGGVLLVFLMAATVYVIWYNVTYSRVLSELMEEMKDDENES